MFAFLMVLFVILCLFLALAILLQQGKGDLGLGALGGSTQMLFGGSGGQEFFEKITWILGTLFLVSALGLSVLAAKRIRQSSLKGFVLPTKTAQKPALPATSEQTAPTMTETPQESSPAQSPAPLQQ